MGRQFTLHLLVCVKAVHSVSAMTVRIMMTMYLTVLLLAGSLPVGTLAFRNCRFCGDDYITEEESRQYCVEGAFHHINQVVSNPSREQLKSSLYHDEGATVTYSKVTSMFTFNMTHDCCVQWDENDPSFACDYDEKHNCRLTRPYFIVRLENICIFKFNDFIYRNHTFDPAPRTMTLKSPCPFDLSVGDELIVKLHLVVSTSWCPEWRFVISGSGQSCVRHQRLFKATPDSLKHTARLCGLHKPRKVGYIKAPHCPGVSQDVSDQTCDGASMSVVGLLPVLLTVAASLFLQLLNC